MDLNRLDIKPEFGAFCTGSPVQFFFISLVCFLLCSPLTPPKIVLGLVPCGQK